MIVEQFLVEGLGHASHLLIDDRTGFAAVIDPRRDIDLYLQAAQERNVHITHVLETHDHNDFVSGSRELAAATGAHIVAGADAGLPFAYQDLRDGELIELGSIAILAIATPSHPP
ncbi:MAG: MBL fold metallo-hydrolase, partial [Dehalococcoidia bacterium]